MSLDNRARATLMVSETLLANVKPSSKMFYVLYLSHSPDIGYSRVVVVLATLAHGLGNTVSRQAKF